MATKVVPEVSTTGSFAVYARVWRSAPFPRGVWYWDDFRVVEHPVNQRESKALHDERWRPWNVIVSRK